MHTEWYTASSTTRSLHPVSLPNTTSPYTSLGFSAARRLYIDCHHWPRFISVFVLEVDFLLTKEAKIFPVKCKSHRQSFLAGTGVADWCLVSVDLSILINM